MAIGVNFSKTNLSVVSRPIAGPTFSKTNLSVESHVPGRVILSKTNLAILSNDEIPPANRRRPLILG